MKKLFTIILYINPSCLTSEVSKRIHWAHLRGVLGMFTLSSILYSLFSKSAFALDSKPFNIGDQFQPAQTKAFNNFGDLATSILTILTSAAGVIAVFFIIIGGLKIVTGAGDEKKMASASQTITYAIIGLAITALAFVILQVVQYMLGAKVGTI